MEFFGCVCNDDPVLDSFTAENFFNAFIYDIAVFDLTSLYLCTVTVSDLAAAERVVTVGRSIEKLNRLYFSCIS